MIAPSQKGVQRRKLMTLSSNGLHKSARFVSFPFLSPPNLNPHLHPNFVAAAGAVLARAFNGYEVARVYDSEALLLLLSVTASPSWGKWKLRRILTEAAGSISFAGAFTTSFRVCLYPLQVGALCCCSACLLCFVPAAQVRR